MAIRSVKLSIRLDLPDGSRFGPGKASLLVAIQQTGSISGAATSLSMSYPRALRLVSEMNTQFKKPLIDKYQGGISRGGATLTDYGKKALELYERVTTAMADESKSGLLELGQMTK